MTNWYEIRRGVSPSKKEKIVKVSDGGTPSGGGTFTLYVQGNILDQTASNKATLRL